MFTVLVYHENMGVDKPGVLRGECTECECEEFESVNSTACEYCGHLPVKHENQSEVLSPPAKKRFVLVSSNISQPLCNLTQTSLDPTRAVFDLSLPVTKSNVAVSGLLERCCDSAHSFRFCGTGWLVRGGLPPQNKDAREVDTQQ